MLDQRVQNIKTQADSLKTKRDKLLGALESLGIKSVEEAQQYVTTAGAEIHKLAEDIAKLEQEVTQQVVEAEQLLGITNG